jgi:diguanylate cyclase (GGDEF)-like protein
MVSANGFAERFLNIPLGLLVMLTVSFSVAFSVLFTCVTELALRRAIDGQTLFIAAVVPAIVAGPVAHFGFRLMHLANDARREAQRLANTDLLTGILNRRRFVEIARAELARGNAEPIALLLMDLDDFKRINDSHGHDAGDTVLKLVSQTCLTALRPGDPFARWGGEEFIALLPGAGVEAALSIAAGMRDAIAAAAVVLGGQAIRVTASIGIAVDDAAAGANLDALISRADHAMYEAKRAGKNAAKLEDSGRATSFPSGAEHSA